MPGVFEGPVPGRLRDILHCSLVLCPQNRRRYQRIHAICVQLGQVEMNLSFIYFSSFLFFGNLLKKKKKKIAVQNCEKLDQRKPWSSSPRTRFIYKNYRHWKWFLKRLAALPALILKVTQLVSCQTSIKNSQQFFTNCFGN